MSIFDAPIYTITEARPVYDPSKAYRFYRLSEHLARGVAVRKTLLPLEKDAEDSPIGDTHVVEANRAKILEAINTNMDIQSLAVDFIESYLEGNRQAILNHGEAAYYLANFHSLPDKQSAELCTVLAANELDFEGVDPEQMTKEQLAERENKVHEQIKDPKKWKSLKDVRPGRRHKALGVQFAGK
jgi:hypothetical protein